MYEKVKVALGYATGPLLLGVLILVVATDPAQVVLDVIYSITGFCIGFLYATSVYDANRRGRNGRQ